MIQQTFTYDPTTMPADDDDGGDALSAAIKRKGKKKKKYAVLDSVDCIID